jgi:hypothetical protein
MKEPTLTGEPIQRAGLPVAATARAFVLETEPAGPERTLAHRVADLARHWRAVAVGAAIVGGGALWWQVREAQQRAYVVLVENASFPAESGIPAISKHDLAAMINTMAVDSDEGGILPDGAWLEAAAPKVGDLVRVTIRLENADPKGAERSARSVADSLEAAIDRNFKPRIAAAEGYLRSQIEVTNQSAAQAEALLRDELPQAIKSDRADLVGRVDELRARAAAMTMRLPMIRGPKLVSPPTLLEDPGTPRRAGIVALAALVGGVVGGSLGVLAGGVRAVLRG